MYECVWDCEISPESLDGNSDREKSQTLRGRTSQRIRDSLQHLYPTRIVFTTIMKQVVGIFPLLSSRVGSVLFPTKGTPHAVRQIKEATVIT